MVSGDLVLLYTSLYLAVSLRYFAFSPTEFWKLFTTFTYLYLCAIVIMFIVGLYDATQTKNSWRFYQKILVSSIIWGAIGIFYFYLNPKVTIAPKTILLLNSILGFGTIALWRYIYNTFLSVNILKTNVVFAGFTPETEELIQTLQTEPERGYDVQGVIENSALPQHMNTLKSAPTLHMLQEQLTDKKPIHLLVISPEFATQNEFLKELYRHLFEQIQVVPLAQFYEDTMHRIPPFTFSEGWFLANLHEQQKKIYDRFRILLDYAATCILGIGFATTFPFVALLIKLTSPGPIFFKQERVGRHEKKFTLYKYRTMKVLGANGSAEMHGPEFAKDKDSRITIAGKFLRRTRLDELPQCINILKSDMSIIGPRPERPEFVQQLTAKMPFYSLRHLIKPGLTGWAQLHKAYYGTIEENLRKLEYDLYYIKNRGFLLDISILLRTVNIVIKMMGR